ncbi:MAG: ribose-5-phosphate isomerase RpiA [Candidatus Heimdallarchaeaceae archaeon]
MSSNEDKEKAIASKYVVDNLIFDGQIIGIGTGTTVNIFIHLLSELVSTNELDIICIPSSFETKIQLAHMGLPIGTLVENGEVDIYVDGADIITQDLVLIKGGGAALTMEKIVAHAAQEFLVIADSTKYPRDLLSYPVPVEIIPLALNTVIKPIFELGGEFRLRYGTGKIGPVISDNGNIIGDITFRESYQPEKMERDLNAIPGVIENGIFSRVADKIVIGGEQVKVIKREK